LVGVMAWLKPAALPQTALPDTVSYDAIRPILEQRCYQCHGAELQMKNVRLDSRQHAEEHAQQIYQQVVLNKLMPLSNATQMTEEERSLIGRWFEGLPARR